MVSLSEAAAVTDLVTRAAALAAAGLAAVVAATHWAVRHRKISPIGGWSKTVRSLSDPFLRPIEHRLARRGGNPQDGSLWLLGITVVFGLILINGVRWGFEVAYSLGALRDASPRTWAQVAVGWVFGLLIASLFVRFLASWLNVPSNNRWIRPFYWLTEWLLRPLRRIVPPIGRIDVSPMLGYFALVLLHEVIDRLAFGR